MKEIAKSSYNEQCIRMCAYCKQLDQTVINGSIANCKLEFYGLLAPQECKCIKLSFLYCLVYLVPLALLYLLYTHTKPCADAHSLPTRVTLLCLNTIPSRTASLLHRSYQYSFSHLYISKGLMESIPLLSRKSSAKVLKFSNTISRVYCDFFSPCQGNHSVGDTAKMLILPDSVSVLVPST